MGPKVVKIVNLYIPPIRAVGEGSEEDIGEGLRGLPRTRSIIWCGDFYGHNHQFDSWIEGDERGERVMELVAEERLMPINDGDATWYARREGCSQKSTPDLTVVISTEIGKVSWRMAHRLSSDHLPIIIDWKRPHAREKKRKTVHLNGAKSDWEAYKEALDARMESVEGETDMRKKGMILERIIREAAEIATLRKVTRKGDEAWLNADIKRVRRERNRARRNIWTKRREWATKNIELQRLTREAKNRI